jgi:uncharacterized membrane protein
MKSTMFASEPVESTSISQPPSTLDTFLDRSFRGLTFAFAWLTILLMVYLLWRVGECRSCHKSMACILLPPRHGTSTRDSSAC